MLSCMAVFEIFIDDPLEVGGDGDGEDLVIGEFDEYPEYVCRSRGGVGLFGFSSSDGMKINCLRRCPGCLDTNYCSSISMYTPLAHSSG